VRAPRASFAWLVRCAHSRRTLGHDLGSANSSATDARAAASIPGVTVVAVCGRTLAPAKPLADKIGAVEYDEIVRFLADWRVHTVVIGTPSGRR
jgi:predicted dehydrogenase